MEADMRAPRHMEPRIFLQHRVCLSPRIGYSYLGKQQIINRISQLGFLISRSIRREFEPSRLVAEKNFSNLTEKSVVC